MSNKISPAVIRRLPRYYRYLKEVEARGVDKLSSSQMSEDMGLNASQIRRDFNYFGGFGQQGYGYSVPNLRAEIAHILGLDKQYQAIIIGAGRIGQALLGYKSFKREGFDITDIFDVDRKKLDMQVGDKKVKDAGLLKDYLQENKTDIAILCTPKEVAQQMADLLVSYGIRAIWNFAPVDVEVRKGVAVENIHMSDSLYVLSYSMINEE